MGQDLASYQHPEGVGGECELLQRPVGMVGREEARQGEHRGQQRGHPHHARGDCAQQRGLRAYPQWKEAHHDREKQQGVGGVGLVAHDDHQVARDDAAYGGKHGPAHWPRSRVCADGAATGTAW